MTGWWHVVDNLKQWYVAGDLTLLPCLELDSRVRLRCVWNERRVRRTRLTTSRSAPTSPPFQTCPITAAPSDRAGTTHSRLRRDGGGSPAASYSWCVRQRECIRLVPESTHTFNTAVTATRTEPETGPTLQHLAHRPGHQRGAERGVQRDRAEPRPRQVSPVPSMAVSRRPAAGPPHRIGPGALGTVPRRPWRARPHLRRGWHLRLVADRDRGRRPVHAHGPRSP